MKIDKDIMSYLLSQHFSNSIVMPISEPENGVPDRFTLIENMVKDKKIIHFGCADHLSLIDEKIKNNLWLHGRLCRKAKKCLGIDIDRGAVEYLRSHLNIQDVVAADILSEDVNEISTEKWDYAVLADVIEHVDNAVAFLKTLREKLKFYVFKTIITVPNAFFWLNFVNLLKHKECINSDHRYWFTPYTLSKIVTAAGMVPDNFVFCENSERVSNSLSMKAHVKNAVLKKYPSLRESIFLVARL